MSHDSSLSAQENGAHLQEVIAATEEGATIVVGPGEYDIPRDEATSVEGQTGWYFAITADNVTVIGAPGAVLTSTVKSENGAWASQNMVSIFGDNVTFQGFTIIRKEEVNKAIEVRGENSIIRDVTIRCADHTERAQLQAEREETERMKQELERLWAQLGGNTPAETQPEVPQLSEPQKAPRIEEPQEETKTKQEPSQPEEESVDDIIRWINKMERDGQ